MDKLISELLIPPERVRKGDFVLNLSRGEGIIGVPGTRVKNYIWCPRNSAARVLERSIPTKSP